MYILLKHFCLVSLVDLESFFRRAEPFLVMSLTPEEQRQLVSLLQKAQPDEKISEAVLQAAAHGMPPQSPCRSDGEFSLVTSSGAMTDACKRRDPVSEQFKNTKRSAVSVPMPSSAAPDGYSIQYESDIPGYEGGPWTAPDVKPTYLPSQEEDAVSFPEGISSLAQWGQTLLSFGQFNNQGLSYLDVVSSSDQKKTNYVRWCKARSKTAGGHLKDFCDFIVLYEQQTGLKQGPVIPGTSQVRQYKA